MLLSLHVLWKCDLIAVLSETWDSCVITFSTDLITSLHQTSTIKPSFVSLHVVIPV